MNNFLKLGVCGIAMRSHYGNETYYLSDEVDAALAAKDAENAALKAYAARLDKLQEWKPMDSVPKDRNLLLVRRDPRSVTYGHWAEPAPIYVGDCGGSCRCPEYEDSDRPPGWYSEDGSFTAEDPPIAWMLPPDPPAREAIDAFQVNRFVAEANAALAAERQANTELAMRERKSEADLADANHALMLANSNADAFKRVAEQRQAEIERLRRALRSTVEAIRESIRTGISLNNRDFDQVGADALSVLAMCGNGVTNHPHLICELYQGHHGLCGTDDDAAEKPTTGASNG